MVLSTVIVNLNNSIVVKRNTWFDNKNSVMPSFNILLSYRRIIKFFFLALTRTTFVTNVNLVQDEKTSAITTL